MNSKTNPFLGIFFLLILVSIHNQAFGEHPEEKLFPDWVRQSTELWVNDEITDSEFFTFIESVLSKKLIVDEMETNENLKHAAKMVINDFPELDKQNYSELVPFWVKDRAEWWIDGKITDSQFLRTIHYLREIGYLDYNPEKNIFSNDETFESSLERFLLNDEELLNITKETKWRTFSTEYEFSEKEGVVDSVQIIFNDITRIYEPIFYKFKVPTLVMKILEFNNQNDLDNYWKSFEDTDKEKIFDSAYYVGTPNENSECFFNYNSKGALTSCTYDNLIVQIIVFDEHGEHFDYNVKSLTLDETEPTTRISSEILKKISQFKHEYVNSQLYTIMQKNILYENGDSSINEDKTVPKSKELEKSAIQGVKNFSCTRDDFGLVTISGQYYNDYIQRTQVDLSILFLDMNGTVIGKTSTSFNDVNEFESKRFVGHSKWNENFHSCQILVN
ncbi:MAG: hypothetical protein ACW9W3_08055 [Candidatus Nitrosopumilus sp. bin_68KS]